MINLYRTVLDSYLAKAPAMKASIAPSQEKAIKALDAWSEWLSKDLIPRATRDFRIGPDLYRAKLRFSLDSGLTPEQIGEQARKDTADTHAVMYETARKLYKGSSTDRHEVIRDVLNKLAEKRPTAATIVEQSRRGLAERHCIRAQAESGLCLRHAAAHRRDAGVPARRRRGQLRVSGPLEKNGITFFNISASRELEPAAGGVVLPRVQRLHGPGPDRP